MINVYASKIPMQWVSTKTGDKIKFLEFTNAKKPGAPIYYGLRQVRPEGFELSKNFDAAMIDAIKAKGGLKTNVIVVKGVDTKYTGGKLWMLLNDGCEIIVIDAVTKTPKFRKVVNGTDSRPDAAVKEAVRKEVQSVLKEAGWGSAITNLVKDKENSEKKSLESLNHKVVFSTHEGVWGNFENLITHTVLFDLKHKNMIKSYKVLKREEANGKEYILFDIETIKGFTKENLQSVLNRKMASQDKATVVN
jgi:hypothetical protein